MNVKGFFSRLRGRRRARLTSVTTPIFGLGWEYGTSEREAIQGLFSYLESRRALWIPFNSEDHERVVRSILDMRDRITTVQQHLRQGGPAIESVRRLRFTCERFLTDTPQAEVYFYSNLGELRGIFGAEIGRLAQIFGLDVEPPLSWIVPPATEEEVGEFIPRGEIERSVYLMGPGTMDELPTADSGHTVTDEPDEPDRQLS